MLAAAKEKITPVLPLAARLPVNQFGFVSSNSRQGFPPEIPPCIGPSTFVSSTSHWGCAPFSCDSTVARLVGLDYFGARYFSGAQGRFTSPDEPFADQGPEDPQSWNLYAYVRDNPLISVDPTGMFEEKNPREKPPDPIEVMLVLSVFQLMSREMQAAQQGQELLQFAWNVIGGPHDPGCMAQMIAGWGAAGATVGGTVGLGGFAFAGIGETVTVPGGVALGTGVGAAAGGAVGMIKCAKGTPGGGGGGGGQPASEKTAVDMAKQIERDLGKDARRAFHDVKQGGVGDRTLEQLKADAKALYEEFGNGKTPPRWMQ